MRPEELQFIELGDSLLQKSDYYRGWGDEYESNVPKIEHFQEESQKYIKKLDERLSKPPWFVDSKSIREDIAKELVVKSEYKDAWETYSRTKRFNFPKFLKDVLPYMNTDCVKRLKHGKYLRNMVDGIIDKYDTRVLEIAGGRGPSYAVLNPDKTEEFYTESILKDLSKELDGEELIDLTKDEELINDALGELKEDELKEKERIVAQKNAYSMPTRPSEHKRPFQDFEI
ncbi:MAG: hypothetical protein ACLFQ8_02530 [Candidatus Aenigmatarchaeota archaeon]